MKEPALKDYSLQGTLAVRKLRLAKLNNGLPFMINSNDLPQGFCYFEYPDGAIKLARLWESQKEFNIVRDLSSDEIHSIKSRYHLD